MNLSLGPEISQLQRLNIRFAPEPAGNFREVDVYCTGDTTYRFLESSRIETTLTRCMHNFITLFNSSSDIDQLCYSLAYFWQTFIAIHPFGNANGRTAKEYLQLKCSQRGYNQNLQIIDQVSFKNINKQSLDEYSIIFKRLLT